MARSATRLSVVVPVYGVERYLASSLDSLLAQRLLRGMELEVVCVDDGSTDGSSAILDRFAADPSSSGRVRLLRQENAGLGAARNVGVAAATGDLLTFLDSDDDLPRNAYLPMLKSMKRTQSQIAIGTLVRDLGASTETGPLMRRNHALARRGITVGEQPLLLADVFAVNKIFRRDFWDDAQIAFPVGTRYEDQPTLTRALLAATSIDVLTEVVYAWRVRDDGSSITQGRANLADLVDRVQTKRDSTEQVLARATGQTRQVWFAEILPIDMWEYFRAAPSAGDDYWELLRVAMGEFWNDATVPFDRTRVPVQQRLMGHLVSADRRTDLAQLIEFVDAHGVPVVDGVFQHPWLADLTLPAGTREVG